MQIQILSVGKIKEDYLKRGIEDYKNRLSKYSRVKIVEVAEEDISNKIPREVMAKEALKLSKYLQQLDSWYIIALDREGDELSSEQLARHIDTLLVKGKSNIVFVIGGALGLDESIIRLSDMRLSLSKLTLTHQLARFILLEQIYRSFKINRGEPYHY